MRVLLPRRSCVCFANHGPFFVYSYFEENPAELAHLRHDNELRTARRQDHMKHIPDYLLPADGRRSLTQGEEVEGSSKVRFKSDKHKDRGHRKGRWFGRGHPAGRGRKKDPLKTFKA